MATVIFIGFAIWSLSYLFGNLAMDLIERWKNTKKHNTKEEATVSEGK